MNDRELLEMAAKACGFLHVDYAGIDYDGGDGIVLIDGIGRHCTTWNPLQDDRDALRLAVKLKLDISIGDHVQVSWWRGQGLLDWVNEDCCRLAIVRAAAELGKGKVTAKAAPKKAAPSRPKVDMVVSCAVVLVNSLNAEELAACEKTEDVNILVSSHALADLILAVREMQQAGKALDADKQLELIGSGE